MGIDSSAFYDEATDLLDSMRHDLENINFQDYKTTIQDIFRAIHTIKGNAGFFAFNDIIHIAHLGEDLLDKIRMGEVLFDEELKELFLNLTDILETLSEKNVKGKQIDSYTNSLIKDIEDELKTQLLPTSPKRITQKAEQKAERVVAKEIKKVVQKTILIVDDSSLIRNVASKAAFEAGLNVITATDGYEGLAKAKHQKFDLIFSDVNMPQMGGLEMIEAIRKIDGHQYTPIVMLTTESKEELKKIGKSLGVKAWMVKPFNKEKFAIVLEKVLSV
jgi:two-component system, chemotaxis family, chemotaxis protein CheY